MLTKGTRLDTCAAYLGGSRYLDGAINKTQVPPSISQHKDAFREFMTTDAMLRTSWGESLSMALKHFGEDYPRQTEALAAEYHILMQAQDYLMTG